MFITSLFKNKENENYKANLKTCFDELMKDNDKVVININTTTFKIPIDTPQEEITKMVLNKG